MAVVCIRRRLMDALEEAGKPCTSAFLQIRIFRPEFDYASTCPLRGPPSPLYPGGAFERQKVGGAQIYLNEEDLTTQVRTKVGTTPMARRCLAKQYGQTARDCRDGPPGQHGGLHGNRARARWVSARCIWGAEDVKPSVAQTSTA